MFGESGRTLTRASLLRAVVGAGAAGLGLLAGARAARGTTGPRRAKRELRLDRLRITSGGVRHAGDHRLLATVSPGSTSRPKVEFDLSSRARVQLELLETSARGVSVLQRHAALLRPGRHRIPLRLSRTLDPGTYIVRLTVTDGSGTSRVYGPRPGQPARRGRPPVLRVLGVEAATLRQSYRPGSTGQLRIESDARRLTVQVFRSGTEQERAPARDTLVGTPVGGSVGHDWRRRRRGRHRVALRIGDWPTGMYFARITAEDGRVGYAPFVVRPSRLGTARVAVVLPTYTWQAYNFYDHDGDGWGDTWYAGGSPPVLLDRPYQRRGVPPHYHNYDLPFLRWLHATGKEVDYLAEDDLDRIRSGRVLRKHYDLVVFPGHSEYVTERMYDTVEQYRDLGGNLMFLSANSFFWKVRKHRGAIERVKLWRDLGRPEASLVGVQYLANDDGSIQDAFVVQATEQAPWLFAGTGLSNGSTFGHYGVEIDARTKDSPQGTRVLATLPDLFGPGRTGEMTYYETEGGARVFASGVLAFGGSADRWVVARLLENLWAQLAPPAGQPSSGRILDP